jgi:hypothetical protein
VVGLAHDDVGRRFDTGGAGSQQELAVRGAVSRANLSAMATTASSVSALWSLRKAITGITEQSVLNSSGALTEACCAA